MSKIIVLITPVEGHFNPFVPLLKHLIIRQHQVVCIAGRRFSQQVEQTGATFHPYPQQWDCSVQGVYVFFPQLQKLNGLAQVKYYLKNVMHDPIPDVVKTLQAVLASFAADVVISDSFQKAGLWCTELGGPPNVSVSVLPLALPAKDLAPVGLGLVPGTSFFTKLRNNLLQVLLNKLVFKDADSYANAIRRSIGLPPQEKPGQIEGYEKPNLFLHMSIPGFEYSRPEFPPNFRFIGAVLLSKRAGYTKPPWWPELESERPVILINQGTVAKDLNQLIKPAIEALKNENVLVLAVPVEHGEIEHLPANTRTEPYIPFGDLLPHVDIMITNGGFGGTQNALAHGIPIVISGTTEDKMEVAARVEHSGAGLNLRKQDPTPGDIWKAVRTILSDPSYKLNAQRLQAEYAQYNPAILAADYTEALIESTQSVMF